jgi:hypothetical protein
MDKRNASTLGRRAFLRRLGAGAAAAMTSSGALGQESAGDAESGDWERQARFKETEHVRTFYRVNRYPSRGSHPC